jgi:hypothetical protein
MKSKDKNTVFEFFVISKEFSMLRFAFATVVSLLGLSVLETKAEAKSIQLPIKLMTFFCRGESESGGKYSVRNSRDTSGRAVIEVDDIAVIDDSKSSRSFIPAVSSFEAPIWTVVAQEVFPDGTYSNQGVSMVLNLQLETGTITIAPQGFAAVMPEIVELKCVFPQNHN